MPTLFMYVLMSNFQCLRDTGIGHVEISAVNVVMRCREKCMAGVGYLR
jgi:hypothetical protein